MSRASVLAAIVGASLADGTTQGASPLINTNHLAPFLELFEKQKTGDVKVDNALVECLVPHLDIYSPGKLMMNEDTNSIIYDVRTANVHSTLRYVKKDRSLTCRYFLFDKTSVAPTLFYRKFKDVPLTYANFVGCEVKTTTVGDLLAYLFPTTGRYVGALGLLTTTGDISASTPVAAVRCPYSHRNRIFLNIAGVSSSIIFSNSNDQASPKFLPKNDAANPFTVEAVVTLQEFWGHGDSTSQHESATFTKWSATKIQDPVAEGFVPAAKDLVGYFPEGGEKFNAAVGLRTYQGVWKGADMQEALQLNSDSAYTIIMKSIADLVPASERPHFANPNDLQIRDLTVKPRERKGSKTSSQASLTITLAKARIEEKDVKAHTFTLTQTDDKKGVIEVSNAAGDKVTVSNASFKDPDHFGFILNERITDFDDYLLTKPTMYNTAESRLNHFLANNELVSADAGLKAELCVGGAQGGMKGVKMVNDRLMDPAVSTTVGFLSRFLSTVKSDIAAWGKAASAEEAGLKEMLLRKVLKQAKALRAQSQQAKEFRDALAEQTDTADKYCGALIPAAMKEDAAAEEDRAKVSSDAIGAMWTNAEALQTTAREAHVALLESAVIALEESTRELNVYLATNDIWKDAETLQQASDWAVEEEGDAAADADEEFVLARRLTGEKGTDAAKKLVLVMKEVARMETRARASVIKSKIQDAVSALDIEMKTVPAAQAAISKRHTEAMNTYTLLNNRLLKNFKGIKNVLTYRDEAFDIYDEIASVITVDITAQLNEAKNLATQAGKPEDILTYFESEFAEDNTPASRTAAKNNLAKALKYFSAVEILNGASKALTLLHTLYENQTKRAAQPTDGSSATTSTVEAKRTSANKAYTSAEVIRVDTNNLLQKGTHVQKLRERIDDFYVDGLGDMKQFFSLDADEQFWEDSFVQSPRFTTGALAALAPRPEDLGEVLGGKAAGSALTKFLADPKQLGTMRAGLKRQLNDLYGFFTLFHETNKDAGANTGVLNSGIEASTADHTNAKSLYAPVKNLYKRVDVNTKDPLVDEYMLASSIGTKLTERAGDASIQPFTTALTNVVDLDLARAKAARWLGKHLPAELKFTPELAKQLSSKNYNLRFIQKRAWYVGYMAEYVEGLLKEKLPGAKAQVDKVTSPGKTSILAHYTRIEKSIDSVRAVGAYAEAQYAAWGTAAKAIDNKAEALPKKEVKKGKMIKIQGKEYPMTEPIIDDSEPWKHEDVRWLLNANRATDDAMVNNDSDDGGGKKWFIYVIVGVVSCAALVAALFFCKKKPGEDGKALIDESAYAGKGGVGSSIKRGARKSVMFVKDTFSRGDKKSKSGDSYPPVMDDSQYGAGAYPPTMAGYPPPEPDYMSYPPPAHGGDMAFGSGAYPPPYPPSSYPPPR